MIRKIAIAAIVIFCGVLFIYYFLPETKLPHAATIDKLVVLKAKRKLLAYSQKKLVKTYSISLGFCPTGKKEFDGDGKTPEGSYFINDKNQHSVCYKNLGISYPNQDDMANAKKARLQPGGAIKIHGLSNGRG